MENDGIDIQKAKKVGGRAVSRPLWFAICETMVGRRHKATEGLAMMAAARLSAQAEPNAASHTPGAEIG